MLLIFGILALLLEIYRKPLSKINHKFNCQFTPALLSTPKENNPDKFGRYNFMIQNPKTKTKTKPTLPDPEPHRRSVIICSNTQGNSSQ